MEIVPYAPWHLRAIALQPHQQQLGVALREHGWAEQVSAAGPCWTALAPDRLGNAQPIACAGFQECWEGRAIAWAILAETAGRHMAALTRAVRRALASHPATRIEAQALVGFTPADRWARLLGFVPETVLRNFHQGRDYQAFVYLKGDSRALSVVHESIDGKRRGIGNDCADQDADHTERAMENHAVENIDDNHRHRNQAHHHDAGRHEKAHHKACGYGKEKDNAQHPFDPREKSTPTCMPSLEPRACADKIGMMRYQLVDQE